MWAIKNQAHPTLIHIFKPCYRAAPHQFNGKTTIQPTYALHKYLQTNGGEMRNGKTKNKIPMLLLVIVMLRKNDKNARREKNIGQSVWCIVYIHIFSVDRYAQKRL